MTLPSNAGQSHSGAIHGYVNHAGNIAGAQPAHETIARGPRPASTASASPAWSTTWRPAWRKPSSTPDGTCRETCLPPDLVARPGANSAVTDQKPLSQETLNPPLKEGCTAGQLAAVNGSTEPTGAC